MSLCINFELNLQIHHTVLKKKFRQINELKNMKSLHYERQCDHKKHLREQ